MAVLIVGATRGLGAALAKQYAEEGQVVYATTRDTKPPHSSEALPDKIQWVTGVDLLDEQVGGKLASQLRTKAAFEKNKIDTLVCTHMHRRNEEITVLTATSDHHSRILRQGGVRI